MSTSTTERMIAFWKSGLFTALPGVIVSFDHSNRMAVVQPSIPSSVVEVPPIIYDTPVLFFSSSMASITFPLVKDDPVLLIFSMRSTDNWKDNGHLADPSDSRLHDYTDAIAIPGLLNLLHSFLAIDPNNMVISFGIGDMKSSISISPAGTITMSGASGVEIGNGTIGLLSAFVTLLTALTAGGAVVNTSSGAWQPTILAAIQNALASITTIKGTTP